MGGPQALLGWLLGAVLCLCDGSVWAELGSALPRSGGSFHYLREAFGPQGLGRLLGFLYLWQTLLIGPMSIASGTVGMAHYLTWLEPGLSATAIAAIAATVCLVNLILLWRDIRVIGMLGRHQRDRDRLVPVDHCFGRGAFRCCPRLFLSPHAFVIDGGFWMGLGAATLIGVLRLRRLQHDLHDRR
jgi:amino acid transporter